MKRTFTILLASAALALTGLAAGCDEPQANGSAEKVGEAVDNAMDDATRNSRDLTDGAAENAGEALDKAGGNKAATDNN